MSIELLQTIVDAAFLIVGIAAPLVALRQIINFKHPTSNLQQP